MEVEVLITFLGIVLALAGCAAFFALSVCWLAHQEETMKDEDDYPDERPVLKVTVLKQEVGNDNEDGNKGNR